MNTLKKLTILGTSIAALLIGTTNSYSSSKDGMSALSENEVGKAGFQIFLSQALSQGKEFSIDESKDGKTGFRPSDFSIIVDPNDSVAYCGYDSESRTVVKKYTTMDQRLYIGIKEALDYMVNKPGISNDSIFDRLYPHDTMIHKLLWKTPFGTSAAGLSAITGLILRDGEITEDPISVMTYNLQKAVKSKETKYIPQIFTVTFDEFQKIKKSHPGVNFLENIDRLLTYKKYVK